MTRDEISNQLKHFIRTSILRSARFDVWDDEPLITGGIIDSFALAHIAVFIESACGVSIPDIDLTKEHMDTLGQMVDLVLALVTHPAPSVSSQTLVPLQAVSPSSIRPIFFCPHGVLGGVMSYRQLSCALGPEQPFYGLQAGVLPAATFRMILAISTAIGHRSMSQAVGAARPLRGEEASAWPWLWDVGSTSSRSK